MQNGGRVYGTLGAILVSILAAASGPAGQPVAAPAAVSGQGRKTETTDLERGKILFYACRACHRLGTAGPPREGPDLAGLFGRVAGTAPGYERYSAALREAGFEWTAARLDAWLKDPNGFLPGNRMRFAGLRRAEDRRDLIAYLKEATATAK